METIIRAPKVSLKMRQLKRMTDPIAQSVPPSSPHESNMPVSAAPASCSRTALQIEENCQSQRQHEQALATAFDEAKRQGFSKGVEEGSALAKKSVAKQAASLMAVLDSLDKARADVLEHTEDAVVEIVYTAVCRIIGDTATNRAAVIGVVEQVFSQLKVRDSLRIRLHPQDIERLEQAAQIDGMVELGQATAWCADTSIDLGGCIVESTTGLLDARLETQLARLRDTLLSARKNQSNHAEDS